MARLRYIGSKSRLAPLILDAIGTPEREEGRFIDPFCGTGAVCREAADRGWPVVASDHLRSATTMTTAQLLSGADVRFQPFGSYHRALLELQSAPTHTGFLFREYAPTGLSASGHERRYFTPDNARRIDGMRRQIAEWWHDDKLSPREHDLLIADLMSATNSVANIAGTYGCFLRHWTGAALRQVALAPRTFRNAPIPFEVKTIDVFGTESEEHDVVYLDPPYTKRQYAAYYHVLETVAYGDEPTVEGITGLRPWEELQSPFCYKRKALTYLCELISNLHATTTYLSYSEQGHIPILELEQSLSRDNSVQLIPLAEIARYCPNDAARANGEYVTEYLLQISKSRNYNRGWNDDTEAARTETSETI